MNFIKHIDKYFKKIYSSVVDSHCYLTLIIYSELHIKNNLGGFNMKATVDQEICIGCGLCTSLCSDIFDMNDEGLAHAIVDTISEDSLSEAEDAKDSCPVGAIEIEE